LHVRPSRVPLAMYCWTSYCVRARPARSSRPTRANASSLIRCTRSRQPGATGTPRRRARPESLTRPADDTTSYPSERISSIVPHRRWRRTGCSRRARTAWRPCGPCQHRLELACSSRQERYSRASPAADRAWSTPLRAELDRASFGRHPVEPARLVNLPKSSPVRDTQSRRDCGNRRRASHPRRPTGVPPGSARCFTIETSSDPRRSPRVTKDSISAMLRVAPPSVPPSAHSMLALPSSSFCPLSSVFCPTPSLPLVPVRALRAFRASPCLSVPLRCSPCLSVPVRASPCLSVPSVPLRASPCLSVPLRASPCLSVPLRCLSVPVRALVPLRASPCLSVPLRACPCLSVPLLCPPCLSPASPCLSLPLRACPCLSVPPCLSCAPPCCPLPLRACPLPRRPGRDVATSAALDEQRESDADHAVPLAQAGKTRLRGAAAEGRAPLPSPQPGVGPCDAFCRLNAERLGSRARAAGARFALCPVSGRIGSPCLSLPLRASPCSPAPLRALLYHSPTRGLRMAARIDFNCDMARASGRTRSDSTPKSSSTSRRPTSPAASRRRSAGDAEDRRLAEAHGVGIGAHPSFPDLQGFAAGTCRSRPTRSERHHLQVGA